MNALIDVTSDIWFKCITDDMLKAFNTETPSIQNYLYSFQHVPSFETNPCSGATHGCELAFVFGDSSLTPAEQKLSLIMRNLWVAFITSGTPTGGPVAWPVFSIY